MQARLITSGPWLYRWLLAAFALIAALAAVDLFADIRAGTTVRHVATEGSVFMIALLGVIGMSWRLQAEARVIARRVADLDQRLAATRADAARWQEEARGMLEGLSREIDRQFTDWRLTSAEREIALFLLKGLSLKEVAYHRGVSDATIRQQARAIYRKAGVSGRHELAAFFLEDLALPTNR